MVPVKKKLNKLQSSKGFSSIKNFVSIANAQKIENYKPITDTEMVGEYNGTKCWMKIWIAIENENKAKFAL